MRPHLCRTTSDPQRSTQITPSNFIKGRRAGNRGGRVPTTNTGYSMNLTSKWLSNFHEKLQQERKTREKEQHGGAKKKNVYGAFHFSTLEPWPAASLLRGSHRHFSMAFADLAPTIFSIGYCVCLNYLALLSSLQYIQTHTVNTVLRANGGATFSRIYMLNSG